MRFKLVDIHTFLYKIEALHVFLSLINWPLAFFDFMDELLSLIGWYQYHQPFVTVVAQILEHELESFFCHVHLSVVD